MRVVVMRLKSVGLIGLEKAESQHLKSLKNIGFNFLKLQK